MINKKTHPIEDGWLHMEFTMTSSQMVSEEWLKNFATNSKPDEYEFAKAEQHGRKLKVICRRKEAATEA